MEIGLGDEGTIRARIVYWIPIDGQIKHELGNDEYMVYWSNQTAHYYAVPRKILYDGGDY